MFDIELLITDEIEHILKQKEKIEDKIKILIRLINYETEFPEYAEEISSLYTLSTGERYECSEYFLTDDDTEFILEYAAATDNLKKTKELLNNILSSNDDGTNYDEIISFAQNEISSVSNIDDFDLSEKVDENIGGNQKRRRYKGFIYPQS